MSEQTTQPYPSSLSEAERQELSNKLFEAIRFDDLDAIKTLLEARADLNNIVTYGAIPITDTALTMACFRQKTTIITMLLAAKAEVNCTVNGESALHIAASTGKAESVLLLLEAKANIEQVRGYGDHYSNALILAAENGHTKVVEILLQKNATSLMENREYTGRTALICAAEKGHLEVVNLLLAAKANPYQDLGGKIVRDFAIKNGHSEIAVLLDDAAREVDALFLAVSVGDAKTVRNILSAKVNVDVYGQSRRTALHQAAASGNSAGVQILLALKASTTAQYRTNLNTLWTARDFASINQHQEIVHLLDKQPAREAHLAVLSGLHRRTGFGSPLFAASRESLFDKQVLRFPLRLAGYPLEKKPAPEPKEVKPEGEQEKPIRMIL